MTTKKTKATLVKIKKKNGAAGDDTGAHEEDAVSKSALQSVEFLHSDFDHCVRCRYILVTMRVGEFLDLVSSAYKSQGAIDGQRDVVRTATATRIRKRLAEDLKTGAIIPPIVIGASVPQATVNRASWTSQGVRNLLRRIGEDKLSVIDGMQRTTVLLENRAALKESTVRVELWLSPSTENLVYRMLILNTGQIPWNLRRQLEVVHRSLIEEIKEKLEGELSIYKADDKQRRTSPGEFQGNDIVEMYLAFNLRKPHVDKESVLADQFSKLDLIEAVSKPEGLDSFVEAMRLLLDLDRRFSTAKDRKGASGEKFMSGRNIFDKVSACTGFMAAYAQVVLGKVGMDRSREQRAVQGKRVRKSIDGLLSKLDQLDVSEMYEFLALDTLREVSDKRAGGLSIGEQEREMFLASFKLLFEEGASLASMEPCWRSQ